MFRPSFRAWMLTWIEPRKPASRRQTRPRLETLEERLPPGDLFSLLGAFGTAQPAVRPKPASTSAARPANTQQPPAAPYGGAVSGSSSGGSGGTNAGQAPAPSASGTRSSTSLPGLDDTGSSGSGSSGTTGTDDGGAGGGGGGSGGGVTGGPDGTTPVNPASPNPVAQRWRIVDVRNGQNTSVMNQVTREKRPLLVGKAPPGGKVVVYANRQALGLATANRYGNWIFRVPRNFVDGNYSFAIVPLQTRLSIGPARTTIDTVAPRVSLTANDFVGKRDTAWVRVTATDRNLYAYPKAAIDVDLNRNGVFAGNELNYRIVNVGGAANLNGLPEGTYRLRARVMDRAGNIGVSSITTMQVDPNAGFIGSQHLLAMENASYGPREGHNGQTELGWNWSITGKYPDELYSIDTQGRVLVASRYTLPKYRDDFKQSLQQLGATITYETTASNLVNAWVPMQQVRNLDFVPHLSTATPIPKPIVKVGSVTTEGDTVIRANTFRTMSNVDGTGVKVGVISDTVNQVAGGLADSVASRDLPNNVQVLLDGGSNGATDEGRGMLEIVHDVAPGASLAFHTANGGADVFAAGIRALAAAGCDVITDDIGYFSSPMFSTGRMGQAIDEVAAQGVFYTTAGGNDGSIGWRDTWSALSATIDGVSGTWMNFGGTPYQNFSLADGDAVVIKFNWDAAYLEGGDPAANFQVPNDLDVYVIDRSDNSIVAQTNTNNPNTDEANELLAYTNATGQSNLAFAFRLRSGPAPTRLAWMNLGSDASFNPGVVGPTLYGQVLAAGALTTGAVAWNSPFTPETFSSRGGNLEIMFDNLGNRYSTPQIHPKPEVTAPDGVHTSFFGQDDGNGGFVFFGTSAATPHIAGAAALLIEQSGASNERIFRHLRRTALDLTTRGFDSLTGDGLIQLQPIIVSLPPDRYESNDTSDRATNLGTVSGTNTQANLTVNYTAAGLPDYDWYQFTTGRTGSVTASINSQDLAMRMFVRNGFALTPISSGTSLAAGSQVYVEVKGLIDEYPLYLLDEYTLTLQVG